MPDVGVLQLKISADASNASKSLRTLQTRLSEINTLAQSFNVSNVSTQIEKIVDAVKGDKSVSTAVKNLGTLLNAIAAFSKVKGIGLSEDQVKRISDLQTAVSGFNLGQAGTQLNKLREALGGEWNTEQAAKAREALETLSHGTKAISESGTAEKIKDVSKSLDGMTGSPVKNIKETTDDIVDYQKAVDEMSNSLKDTQVTFRESFNGKGFLSKVMSGEYSTSVPSFENASVQNWRDTMNGIKEVNDGLKQTDTTSINSIEGLQETLSRLGRISGAGNLQKFADGIRAIENATKSLGQSYLTLNRLTNALEHLGNISANFRLPSFSKLESLARSLQENFNAENGLKRLADGIAYFNNATKGLDLSSIRGIASAIRSINSNAGKTTGASSIESFSESIRNVSNSDNLNGFVEASQRIADVTNAAKDAYDATEQLNSIIQQTGWSAQATAEQFYEMFSAWNSLRMNMSLNAGTNPLMLGDGTDGSGAEWAYWKDGAIEVEGTVSDAMETIRLEAGQTIPLLTGIVEENEKVGKSFKSYNVEDATEKVEALRRIFADSSDAIKQAIANIMGIDKNILFPETAAVNVQTFGKEAQTAAVSAKEFSDSLKRDYGKQMVEDLVNASSKADLLKMRIDALKDSLAQKINNNTVDGNQIAQATSQIQTLQQEYDELIRKSTEAEGETKSLAAKFSELMIGTEGLNGAFKRMFPTISGLLSRFKNLVKYRMLRAIIKQIAEGFKEGTENYYKYSEAIGGSFAPAMDSAVSSLAQMKNSLGAAAAPVIQALIPYLQMAVNWFITAINYANQFFALLGGQTSWSRAVPQTAKAFDKVKKSAGGAGSAIKDLLADWDELNIIQSESGGGGGGGGASAMEDYLNMFEESSVFDEKIKKITDFVRENFDEIFDIIKKIGAALLLWKFSNAFTGLLGTLSGLVAAGLVGAIVFEVSTLFTNQYLKSGDIGWMVADLLSTLLGSYLMKKILTKVLGGEVAKLAIPITFTISAVAGIVTLLGNNDVSALSKEALITSAENGLKMAFAAGYLLKHFGGYTLAQAAGGGLGVGITTFGLVIGLKAIADTLDTREFTSEIIKADFLSAGLVGTGIAITELALGGGAVAALTLGGGAALFTLAALFGIEALLTLKEEDPIKWGDYKATEEEIKAFVDEEIFSGEPKVKISLAKATIEPLGENKTKLEESAATVIGTLQAVKLGLSTSAEADLRSDLETFISTFDATSKNYQDALKVSVSLVPISGAADGGQEIVNNSGSRWNELNGLMEGLAKDLTKQFDIAYNSDLDEVTRKNAELSIEKISNMMTQIADAVSSGQAQAKIAHNINTQIENMTKDSMDSMLAYYGEQRDLLIEELVSVGNDAAEGVLAQYYAYEKLAEYALKDANGNIEDATYKHYIEQANAAYADYESRLVKLKEDAEAAADKTLGSTEGFKKIRKTLLEKLTKSVPTNIEELLASGGVGDINIYKAFIERMLDNIANGQEDSSALKTEMEDLFWGMVYDLVGGENMDTYQDAIEKGIITYADLFKDVDIGSILTEAFGIAGMSPEIQAAWEEIINSLFPDKPISLPKKPILIDTESLKDSLIAGVESVGSVAISPEIILENPSIEESKEHEEAIKEKIRESLRGIDIGRNDAEFDAVQHELAGIYGADLVDSVLEELESKMYDAELPEMDITQPVDINIETNQINSDIGEALTNGLSSAFNFGDMSGTLTSAVEIAQQKIASMYGNTGGGGGMPFAGLPSDITITETRDSGEEIGNTAEGTRQGTSELVTGQNTMNGYMQQVAMSTAGMVDSQGTANSYMAQMVSLLRAIASQGGGGMAPSVAGGVIAGAMKAFDMIRG